MEHSSKKKKKGGGTGQRRPPAADNNSETDILSDELTTLRALLQDDCDLVSENQIKIKLRPYSEHPSYEDLDVSALLSIRFFDGYPYKCPKLQIELEKGLKKSDADQLKSLLYVQANSYVAEGRVMILKLVEAARKFLSEVARHLPREIVAVSRDRPSKGPFVYGFLDLFRGSEQSWHWGLPVEEIRSTSGSQPSRDKVDENMKDNKLNKGITSTGKLDSMEEGSSSADSQDFNICEVSSHYMLRAMHISEDTSVNDKFEGALVGEKIIKTKNQANEYEVKEISFIQRTELDTEIRDLVWEVSSMVFRLHCAKHLEIIPMCLLGDYLQLNRNSVKLLSDGGDMIELYHELRLPFINWVVQKQKASFKRFEICYVYRKHIGHSQPNRYLQGDFDVIGGACGLTEAEVIKAGMDIITRFIHPESCDIHLNHGDLLEAIWSLTGVKADHRQKVAELMSLLGSLRPHSNERKSMWMVIQRQLKQTYFPYDIYSVSVTTPSQELNITEGVIKKLQSVGLMFCGTAHHALPRLKGALQGRVNTLAMKALEELSQIVMYLRIWKIDNNVFIDPLIQPTEGYHRDSFFQIHIRKYTSVGTPLKGTLLAVGGRYDYLIHQMWRSEYKSNPPGAVGTSLALETIIHHSSVDIRKPFRNDSSKSVLVCSRGGGGLLEKRMELVSELWEGNIKAELVPIVDPSPKEQYDYAKEHDINCLIEMSEGSVKIRHLELKREKEIPRESLVKVLSEELASQFRNLSIWN